MATSRGPEQRGARSAGPVRCSGAVLLRVGRNGARYCTYRSTLLPAGPAWSTAQGGRVADQRGLGVVLADGGPAS